MLANGISFIFWALPLRLRWQMGVFLGWLWFDVLRVRRFTVLKNLTIAFPEMDKKKKYEIARHSIHQMCYQLFEFWLLPRLTSGWVEKNVIFEGLEHYEKALQQKKGVLLLSMHIASGDMGLSVMALKGLKVHLITKIFKNKFINDIWFNIRTKSGAHFIDAHGSKNAFEILSTLKKNESVVFVIDQFMGKPFGIETTFFGRKTGTAYGLALFAVKTKAPVVPVYTYRDQNLRTHLVFEPEIVLQDIQDRDLQIQTMTQKYTDKVEELVRRHPDQWMWVHRRWKVWA